MGCHHIRHSKTKPLYTAALPDGDNPTSINVYYDTSNLTTLVHTRSDFPKERADLITLVEYIKGFYFSKAMYWICQVCGYDYYHNDNIEDTALPFLQCLDAVEPKNVDDEDEPLQRYDDDILKRFIMKPNKWFLKDGISLETQKEFEVGFSIFDERITIPVRDELGNLVGIKGRTVKENFKELNIPKYISLYPFPKTQILYGLYKTYDYIKRKGFVVVFESEKAVQQCWSMGLRNVTAIMGHELSLTQIIKLEKLGVKIILAYDKGITLEEIKKQCEQFLVKDNLYIMIDRFNLLSDKSSPSDFGKSVLDKLLKTSVAKYTKLIK